MLALRVFHVRRGVVGEHGTFLRPGVRSVSAKDVDPPVMPACGCCFESGCGKGGDGRPGIRRRVVALDA